jgi:hypothetical protein
MIIYHGLESNAPYVKEVDTYQYFKLTNGLVTSRKTYRLLANGLTNSSLRSIGDVIETGSQSTNELYKTK